MQTLIMPDPVRTASMDTTQLRDTFLLTHLFASGEIRLTYADVDRAVIGSAVPTSKPLVLGTDDSLRAEYFTQRRELGVLNIGSAGSIVVDGKTYEMDSLDCLYIGLGSRAIEFASKNPDQPAEYYLLSYPAHVSHPTTLAKRVNAQVVKLGSEATCNKRLLYKYIHPAGIKSCQLVMGFTQIEPGSAWNTMPPHTHLRRSEVYLYFNVAADARVFHFMGQPQETRHLVVADKQAVISPSWSVHSGVGTSAYTFCWGMGGENQVFDDMDAAPIASLK
jgi:4-deoxy-L-threo-5-hexosulose-uronate ketol-isomerase